MTTYQPGEIVDITIKGDLLREESGRLWFTRSHNPCGDVDCSLTLELVDTDGDRYTLVGNTVPVVLRPLVLVHREPEAGERS